MVKISSWILVVPGVLILLLLLGPSYVVGVIIILFLIIILSSLWLTSSLALSWHVNSSYQAWKHPGAQSIPGFLLIQDEKPIQLGDGIVNTNFSLSLWLLDISCV